MATTPPFDAAKRDFDRDGFVILRGFLDNDELAVLRERAEATARARFARLASLKPAGHTPGKFSNVLKNLQDDAPWFAEQLHHGQHVPLMKALIGDELVPATAAWFDKPSGTEEHVDPHIDGGGRGRGPGVGATIWIALDAANLENGCLHYGRGSHLVEHSKGVFNNFDTSSPSAMAAEVEPGDAAVHNALTVHWSGANLSERPRRAVSFFYWGAQSHAALMKNPAWQSKFAKAMDDTAKALAQT